MKRMDREGLDPNESTLGWMDGPSAVGRGIDRLSGFFGVIAGLLIFEIAFVAFYEVALRKAGYPTMWAFDVTVWSQISLAFLGMAYTQRERGHVNVDVLTCRMPIKAQVILRMVIYGLCMLMSSVILWQGVVFVLRAYASGQIAPEMTRIPIWWVQWPIPLAGLLLLLQFGRQLGQDAGWVLGGSRGVPEGLMPRGLRKTAEVTEE